MKRGQKDAYLKNPNCGKANYSVLFCASATGVYLPPLVVFSSEHVYDKWTENGPRGAVYTCTPKGYMQDVNFESWFVKCFVEFVKDYPKPVVIVYDGHGSHITYDTMEIANKNKIIVVCLPAHTSHAMQPLDVAVFKSVKVKWRAILERFFALSHGRIAVDKCNFSHLLAQLWPQLEPKHMINGFRASGLHPIDPSELDRRIVGMLSEGKNKRPRSPDANVEALRQTVIELLSPTGYYFYLSLLAYLCDALFFILRS